MDKGTFMWITFIGCIKFDLKNSLKHLAVIIALMDNFRHGTGEPKVNVWKFYNARRGENYIKLQNRYETSAEMDKYED